MGPPMMGTEGRGVSSVDGRSLIVVEKEWFWQFGFDDVELRAARPRSLPSGPKRLMAFCMVVAVLNASGSSF
jgi:hypothetical protein